MSGMAIAQTRQEAGEDHAAPRLCRSARHQLGNQRAARCAAGDRRSLFAEDHRRPSLCEEDGSGEEESSSPGHLQQDQRQDHRETEVNSPRDAQSTRSLECRISRHVCGLTAIQGGNMGLLDNLENAAMGKILGSSSNPLASSLLQMIQNQPGRFAGAGAVFSRQRVGRRGFVVGRDWTEPSDVSADQIHQVLGQRSSEGAGCEGGYFSRHGSLSDRPIVARYRG